MRETNFLLPLPNFSSPDTRVAALRALKNELIGHDEKKELWVKSGVLKTLSITLDSGKSPTLHSEKRSEPRSEQEEARLQAIIVVGSIAQGGFREACSPLRQSVCTVLFFGCFHTGGRQMETISAPHRIML